MYVHIFALFSWVFLTPTTTTRNPVGSVSDDLGVGRMSDIHTYLYAISCVVLGYHALHGMWGKMGGGLWRSGLGEWYGHSKHV